MVRNRVIPKLGARNPKYLFKWLLVPNPKFGIPNLETWMTKSEMLIAQMSPRWLCTWRGTGTTLLGFSVMRHAMLLGSDSTE